jgi:DNA-binding MurR/RpiR family transcriptional regulator
LAGPKGVSRQAADITVKAGMKRKTDLSIAESIRQGLGRLTPTERKPALVLLANYPVPGLEPVAQFAKRAGVSGPTILRMVAKLGFASYPRFQQALRDELELRVQAPLARIGARVPGQRPDGDFVKQYGHAIVTNIETSLSEVPRSEFKGVLNLLADRRRRISLVGGRFSASVALHFYLHLRELRPRVQLVSGQTATWVEHLLDFGSKDVLIVFDIRRYQDDVVRFAHEAAAQGSDIVLFTDQWLSPIAAVARHVFALRTAIPSSWESFGALSALTEILVARLQAMSWTEAKRRMQRLETMRIRLNSS